MGIFGEGGGFNCTGKSCASESRWAHYTYDVYSVVHLDKKYYNCEEEMWSVVLCFFFFGGSFSCERLIALSYIGKCNNSCNISRHTHSLTHYSHTMPRLLRLSDVQNDTMICLLKSTAQCS